MRDAVGGHGEAEMSCLLKDKHDSSGRGGCRWAGALAGGGHGPARRRGRVFPSCRRVSVAPGSPLRAFITGDAFCASPVVPILVARLSCSREKVSQAEGFPLANLQWFHLKTTKNRISKGRKQPRVGQ